MGTPTMFLHILLIFSVLILKQCFAFHTGFSKPPIVLVPGDGGNQVDAKLDKNQTVHYICDKTTKDYFNIWLNLELLAPYVIDCWVDNMRLVFDNVTGTTSNSPGVQTRIPDFGNTFPVEWLDPTEAYPGAYFKDIGNTLVALEYKRNRSIRGAPYDFRKAPNELHDYFVSLKALIEETYLLNGKKSIVLVAHSMGGPMCLRFLQEQTDKWKAKYIRALVTLSGAWGGSVKAVKVFLVGDDLGALLLSGKSMKAQQITSPSLAWLLPSPLFWKPNEVFVETSSENYTLDNLKDFFNDIGYLVGWQMREVTLNYSMDFSPPGVEVHCLHGYGVKTIDRLTYTKQNDFPDGNPTFVYGDGDGTVNIRSLEGCLHWVGKQKQRVYHQTFKGVDHMDILKNPNILQYIAQLTKKLN